MAKFEINVHQTITYDHTIVVECEDEESLESAIDKIEKDANNCFYSDFREMATDMEDDGITVVECIEDGSGDCEWEFDYEEADDE